MKVLHVPVIIDCYPHSGPRTALKAIASEYVEIDRIAEERSGKDISAIIRDTNLDFACSNYDSGFEEDTEALIKEIEKIMEEENGRNT